MHEKMGSDIDLFTNTVCFDVTLNPKYLHILEHEKMRDLNTSWREDETWKRKYVMY